MFTRGAHSSSSPTRFGSWPFTTTGEIAGYAGLQIEFFLGERGGFTGDELIVIAAGNNDLLWQAPNGHGQVVANIRKHSEDLAAAGGPTFLVANSPARCVAAVHFNELLKKEIEKFGDKLGVTIFLFDMAGVQASIQQNPGAFGLTNVTDPACPGCGIGIPDLDAINTLVPNPDEYLFWDFIHWTRVVHAIMGDAAANLVQH